MGIDELLAAARRRLARVEAVDLAAEADAGALVVDTRPVEQRQRDGELPGAVVIDRNVLEWRLDPASPSRIAEAADPDRRVIVVCNEGYSSSLAAATLQDLGLTRATDLIGGFQAWRTRPAEVPRAPALILLNGPPGVGKSTLAALYAERHPGTLDLDIDRLHPLVGGWRDDDGRIHDVLRPVALAMAAAHLSGGRDVVLPQHLGRTDEVRAFAEVARRHGADFHEIVLLIDRDEALARFRRRDEGAWDQHHRRLVQRLGGETFLAGLHDSLVESLEQRPEATIVHAEPDRVEATYASIVAALRRG